MHSDERRSYQGKEQVQREILEILADGSKLFPREIAARLSLTSPRVVTELGTLFKRGLVWRDDGPDFHPRKYHRTFQGELFS